MGAPITYKPNFVADADAAFTALKNELQWERRDDAPRCEYYCNDVPKAYVYGKGNGRRLYEPRPYHDVILGIRKAIEAITNTTFEVCFLNMYLNQSDHLGWHADDSPEMDDARPIAIVSLGVEREIWFKPRMAPVPLAKLAAMDPEEKGKTLDAIVKAASPSDAAADIEKVKLGHGSLCLMAAGMQDAWFHRIPKASFQCGERISLTFRGYVEPASV